MYIPTLKALDSVVSDTKIANNACLTDEKESPQEA